MKIEDTPLAFNICVLKWLILWPKEDKVSFLYVLKNVLVHFHLYMAVYTVFAASVRQLLVGVDDPSALVESFIGGIDGSGFIYMNFCCFISMSKIKNVARGIESFKEYCVTDVLDETEAKVRKYSKAIFAYAIMGNTINACLALYGGQNCKRPNQLLYERDPCGYPTRCFFPVNVSGFPLYWILLVLQIYTCYIISMGVLGITMFIIGILMHTIAQLKFCAKLIEGCDLGNKEAVKNIIKYHVAIIKYSETTNLAFSSMMLFHLTVTSLILSVLMFNIVIVNNVTDFLRFGLHLFGWVILLFLICYYGQQLQNESTAVAVAAYSVQWFNAPVSVQKDLSLVIKRAQHPLVLTALNLGIMSFDIFMKIMKAAYSYFTLFLKIKS